MLNNQKHRKRGQHGNGQAIAANCNLTIMLSIVALFTF